MKKDKEREKAKWIRTEKERMKRQEKNEQGQNWIKKLPSHE